MAQAKRDENYVTTLLGVSNADGITPVVLWADPVTHRLLVDITGAAPADAQYVTLAVNATLTNERVLTGTANQVIITDNGAGNTVVLSLPQDIGTGSSPTYTGLTLSSLTANAFLYSNGSKAITSTTAATNGEILIGSTGNVPVKTTITGTVNQVNVTNGAGSITLSTPQDIATTSSPTFANMNLTSTDAGALGSVQTFYHNSASPAADDVIGRIDYKGRNSTPADITYARIQAVIADPVAASEDGKLEFWVYDGVHDTSRRLLQVDTNSFGGITVGDGNDLSSIKASTFQLFLKGGDDGYGMEVQGSNGTSLDSTGGDIEFYPGGATNGNARGGDFLVNGAGAPAGGGGAGKGTGRGGNITMIAGTGGLTGTGGAVSITGGTGGATNTIGGALTLTAGAGGGTANGAVASLVGGASGGGATGNGGAANVTGGAAASTNGSGGSVVLTGGAKTGTGIAGGVRVMSILCRTQAAATAKTTNATLTAAELLTGIITINQGAGGTSAQQLPTGTDITAALPSDFTTGDSFDVSFINISVVDAEDATVTTNTDLTLVGSMDFPAHSAITVPSSGILRFRKTGGTTFTVYRIA